MPFSCHAHSFRQPEILTPDLTWFKGGTSLRPIGIKIGEPTISHDEKDTYRKYLNCHRMPLFWGGEVDIVSALHYHENVTRGL